MVSSTALDISSETNVENGHIEDEKNKDEENDEWLDLLGSGSIMKKLIREGEPDTKPQKLEKCKINYKCTLDDDTLVDAVENFEMYLGDCDVIQGLDVAVSLMNVNERCLLKIAPRLAYGSKGLPGKVPENTSVMYDVELTSVEPEDDPETLNISERKRLGNKKREKGNWWYCRGENNMAIQCYRRALNYLETVESSKHSADTEISDADLQSLLEDRISVCNNMAAAQLKLESYDAALLSLQTVLQCQPNNVKALFRKAKVHAGKNDLPGALKCLQKAKEVAPSDQDIEREINKVNLMIQQEKGIERELARRMFNAPKKNTETKKKPKNLLRLCATVGATVAVGIASVMAYKLKYA